MANKTSKILKEIKAQKLTPIAGEGDNAFVLPNHSGNHIANNIQAKKAHIISDVASDGPQFLAENTRTTSAKVRFGIGELAPLTGAVTTQEAVFSANINKTGPTVRLDDTSAYGIYFYMLPKWSAGNEYFGFSYAEPQANPVTTIYYPIICDMVKDGAIHLGATTNGFSAAVSGQTVTVEPRATTDKILCLKAKAGSTGDFFQVQDSGGTAMSKITKDAYFLTPGQKRVSVQFDKTNSVALENVTGLSVDLAASQKYVFKATLFVNADAVGGHKYAISGTATATSITYQINALNNPTSAYVITSRQTALDGSAGQAGGTTLFVTIEGTIDVNAAGTLTVQFAQNVGGAGLTSSVLVNSTFIVEEIA